jgi:hypothetical protein
MSGLSNNQTNHHQLSWKGRKKCYDFLTYFTYMSF